MNVIAGVGVSEPVTVASATIKQVREVQAFDVDVDDFDIWFESFQAQMEACSVPDTKKAQYLERYLGQSALIWLNHFKKTQTKAPTFEEIKATMEVIRLRSGRSIREERVGTSRKEAKKLVNKACLERLYGRHIFSENRNS